MSLGLGIENGRMVSPGRGLTSSGLGPAPADPKLYLVGSSTTFSPEFNIVGALVSGDTIQQEYQLNGGSWSSPSFFNHDVTSGELGGSQFVYDTTPNLSPGNYNFRVKYKHPSSSYSGYSNIVNVTIPLPPPTVSYRGNFTNANNVTSMSSSIDIGTATADRLVVVGFVCAVPDNGSTNKINTVTVNGVPLTKVYSEETDRHKSWWQAVVPSGDGLQTVQITVTGFASQPKIAAVWTLKNYNSATPLAFDGKGSNTAATIATTIGDAVLGMAYVSNATFSMNPLSTETFTVRRDDNGSSFTSYGALSQFGELVVANGGTFSLKLENPSNPGQQAAGGKMVISYR